MKSNDSGLPIEQFIQALTTQLDNAQSAMAVKANNLNLPLTFAVKDIKLDLRTHILFEQSEVRIRPAAPGDKEASMLSLALTTITRPLIDENARAIPVDVDEPSIKEAVGEDLTDEEQKRLEWAGVRTISQLRRLQETGGDREVERVANLPVDRLRRALTRAARPMVNTVIPYSSSERGDKDPAPLLRIQGRNLMRGGPPRVTIAGKPVSIVRATEQEVIVAPLAHQLSGNLVVETENGEQAEAAFDARPHWVDSSVIGMQTSTREAKLDAGEDDPGDSV